MSKYIIAYEALCPRDKISQNDPRRPAIIAEMRAIDKATTLPQAAQAVAWWGAWPNDQHATAEDFCREVKCLLARLREEKAADWKAACDSALAGTIELGRLKAEIARLRLTDAEREVLQRARQEFPEDIIRRDPTTGESLWTEVATVIDALLERHAK